MGGAECSLCVRATKRNSLPPLLTYEQLCSEIERELRFPFIDIEGFEEAINIDIYSKKEVDYELLAKVYQIYHVEHEVFKDPLSPFRKFFDSLTLEGDRRQVILISLLSFCTGKIEAKKAILWVYLDSERRNAVPYEKILMTVNHFVSLSVRLIPDIATSTKSGYRPGSDKSLDLLLKCTESAINEYAAESFGLKEFWEKHGISHEKGMKRAEFDLWLEECHPEKLFSARYHREQILKRTSTESLKSSQINNTLH